jgi:hypothetical protein
MFDALRQLTGSSDPAVCVRAEMALQIAEAHSRQELSDSEYKELMLDLVRTDKLDEECCDLEAKTMLVTAVYAVAQVV